MAAKHVAVIGGGAVGLCTAYALHQSGCKVTVFDPGGMPGASSTGNAGMIVPSHIVPLAAPGVIAQGLRWLFKAESPFYIKPRLSGSMLRWLLAFRKACHPQQTAKGQQTLLAMMQDSEALFTQLAALPGVDCGLAKRGLLMIHHSDKGGAGNRALVETLLAAGCRAEFLDAQGVRELEPNLPYQAKGAAYFPDDMHLDPKRLFTGLTHYLKQVGVQFAATKVTGLIKEDGRVVAVAISAETIAVDAVVLCAGAWSPAFARDLGIALPIQAGKGYSITVANPQKPPRVPMILSEEKVTLTPMASGLRVAGTLALAGLDASIDRRRILPLLRTAAQFDPRIDPDNYPLDQVWCGFRPCTPDGLPIITRAKTVDNAVIATGHAMLGVTLAPVSGQRAAACLLQRDQPMSDVRSLP